MAGIELTVEQSDLTALAKAMRSAADGKTLRTELTRDLKVVLQPAAQEVKAAVNALYSSSADAPEMRLSIANQVKVSVRYSGRNTGVAVVIPKGKYPRKFNDAPRAFNVGQWRHPVFGNTNIWVQQTTKAGFFDNAFRDPEKYKEAVLSSMEALAERIAKKED